MCKTTAVSPCLAAELDSSSSPLVCFRAIRNDQQVSLYIISSPYTAYQGLCVFSFPNALCAGASSNINEWERTFFSLQRNVTAIFSYSIFDSIKVACKSTCTSGTPSFCRRVTSHHARCLSHLCLPSPLICLHVLKLKISKTLFTVRNPWDDGEPLAASHDGMNA